MSDEEFLARWSRLKQETRAGNDALQPAEPTQAPSPAPPSNAVEDPGAPEVDLSNLPPIDSIDAGTDITAFLRKGIPRELSRAALRRAWAADPADEVLSLMLERALQKVEGRTGYSVAGHDVVLRGACSDCAPVLRRR